MSLVFTSATSAAGLEQLNNYFSSNTYVFGLALSAADAAIFEAAGTKAPDASKYPHFARYYNHVASFSAEERAAAPAVAGLSVSFGAATVSKGKAADDSDDDNIDDLFGDDDSDDESEDLAAAAAAKAAEAKKKKDAAKKSSHKRPAIAKSRIVFEIKPYDADTDLEALAAKIKAIKLEGEFWDEKLENCEDERCTLAEGCKWGEGHHLQPVAFGIFKLIVQCIVQDELTGSDDLIEVMMDKFEDEIQSIDIAAFDKAS